MIKIECLINEYWHFGAHTQELSRPGDFVRYDFFEEQVVLYNDGNAIIAFDNVCPHRGARFFSEARGNSMATCKYHGLTIASGAIHIPEQEIYKDCSFQINKYQVDFCGSFVFFAIKPMSTLAEQLGNVVYDLIEAISFDCNRLVDINQYVFQCNALIAIENALEPDHVPFVHPRTLDPLRLINCRNEFFKRNSIVKFDIGNLSVKKRMDRIIKLFDTGLQRFNGYMSIHIFPFGFISSTYGYSYSIQNFFPFAEEKCTFTSNLYFTNLAPNYCYDNISALVDSVRELNRKIFEEDHEICKRISFRSWLKLIDGPLSTNEVKVRRFRDTIRCL